MISAISVRNHSELTPVVQELTSSLLTPYEIAVFFGVFTSRIARTDAKPFDRSSSP